jgi:hypothetical protein
MPVVSGGSRMRRSRYRVLAVLDVEDWSGRSAVNAANIQRALRRIETEALTEADIDVRGVGRQSRGDGAVLALPGDVAKEVVTTRFVEALRESIAEYNADCAPGESVRIRLSLNAGDVLEGDGEWAGQPVIAACRLVDSAVIKRVLAASTGSPLVVVVSAAWYDAVIKEGHASGEEYREVWVEEKTFSSVAWVKVPGRTSPPGLRSEDDPVWHDQGGSRGDAADPSRGSQPGRTGGDAGNIVNHGNFVQASKIAGDVVFGNKNVSPTPSQERGQ